MRIQLRPEDNSRSVRWLLISVGTACLIFGLMGIVVPILPTTPFLLLAAACYVRSSKRFYDRLMNNRVFGAYLRNYREGLGIPLKFKVFTITMLWLTIAITIIFFAQELWLRALLLIVAAGVAIHIAKIRNRGHDKDMRSASIRVGRG